LLNSCAGLASKIVLSSYLGLIVPTCLTIFFLLRIDFPSFYQFSICLSIAGEDIVATMKDRHTDDDAQLAAMGHKAELQRNYSML
jgi:hypothetical protein